MSSFIEPRVRGLRAAGLTAPSASLDVTAILVESGESVWFYRRALTALSAGGHADDERSFLFVYDATATDAAQASTWWPVRPEGLSAPAVQASQGSEVATRRVSRVSVKAAAADQRREAELPLVRAIAKDFVQAFRGNSQERDGK
jgi:hypothetical protein